VEKMGFGMKQVAVVERPGFKVFEIIRISQLFGNLSKAPLIVSCSQGYGNRLSSLEMVNLRDRFGFTLI